MKNLPNFTIDINGIKGEVFVSDNDGGRFMCVFVKTALADFCEIYNAYGFMVWTIDATGSETQYFPIKLKEKTKLSDDAMREMWKQIGKQMALVTK